MAAAQPRGPAGKSLQRCTSSSSGAHAGPLPRAINRTPLSSSFCLCLPCLLNRLHTCPWCRRARSSCRDDAAVGAGAESAPGSASAQTPPAGTFQALTALLGRCMAAGALDAVSLGKFLLQSKAEGPAAQQQTLEVLGVVEAGGGLAAVGEVVRQELARAGGSGAGQ